MVEELIYPNDFFLNEIAHKGTPYSGLDVKNYSRLQASEKVRASFDTRVLRAGVGEARRVWSGTRTQGRPKWKRREKTRRPVASSDKIRTCRNPGTAPPGMECGSPMLERGTNRELLVPIPLCPTHLAHLTGVSSRMWGQEDRKWRQESIRKKPPTCFRRNANASQACQRVNKIFRHVVKTPRTSNGLVRKENSFEGFKVAVVITYLICVHFYFPALAPHVQWAGEDHERRGRWLPQALTQRATISAAYCALGRKLYPEPSLESALRAAVAQWLDYSPSTLANRVRILEGHDAGFSHVRIMPDSASGSAGIIGDLPFPPPIHSGASELSWLSRLVRRRPELREVVGGFESWFTRVSIFLLSSRGVEWIGVFRVDEDEAK
ncbi:hypothetical protein PR048_019265 [Dryococelus australis]|uniref:Uncharacterized protein n=1 Tax=Dryococelus australis TaxID=614101 RepID=A0ABQ9H325_9NEOP|nr:hypothetical protein PR048_019265 [Dryococelus australis]